jgi:polycystin 1L2
MLTKTLPFIFFLFQWFQWVITPLRDNYITDEYFYLIRVFTGMRRGAGTRSRVAFHLSGEYDISGQRELFDGIREVSVKMTFL